MKTKANVRCLIFLIVIMGCFLGSLAIKYYHPDPREAHERMNGPHP